MNIIRKLKILYFGIVGEIIKTFIRLKMISVPYGISTDINANTKIVISLTSYGRRVNSTLYFTLVSLLRQTYKPNQIILWLDKDEWNCNNLPSNILKLQKKGLDIRFCSNIKSYKKLIPTLIRCPHSNIITVDDDLYYPPSLVQEFVNSHKNYPRSILSNIGHKMRFSYNKLLPYNNWDMGISNVGDIVFPTGAGGVFYPSDCLYHDVTKTEIFLKLAPAADDIWFFFMAYLKNTKAIKSLSTKRAIPIDLFYQKFHKGSSLRDTNCGMSFNDTQLRNVMNFYNIYDTELKTFFSESIHDK